MLDYVEHQPDLTKEEHMKYEVRITVDVDVVLVVDAPDEETAQHWHDLPQQAVLVNAVDVNWNRPWDVDEYEPIAESEPYRYTEKDVRDSLEHIVTELRTNTLLREQPSRDTSITVEFSGDRK